MIINYLIGALFILLVAWLVVSTVRSPYSVDDEVFDAALDAAGDSQVTRIMLTASRRFSSLPSIHSMRTTPFYRSLERKIMAGAGIYGGSVELFLSVQIGVTIISTAMLVGVVVFRPMLLASVAIVLFAVALLAYPFDQVRKRVADRAEIISDDLPDFAELLQVPIALGLGVLPALRFTVERSTGPVAEELGTMLTMLESRTHDDERAPFIVAGQRLGTPEAVNFCNALMVAQIESVSVSQNIAAQAQALRMSQFQRARARAKQLPIKLVFLFAFHFLPLLFIATLVPAATGLVHGLGAA